MNIGDKMKITVTEVQDAVEVDSYDAPAVIQYFTAEGRVNVEITTRDGQSATMDVKPEHLESYEV